MTLEDPFASLFSQKPFEIYEEKSEYAVDRSWIESDLYSKKYNSYLKTKKNIKFLCKQVGGLEDPILASEKIITIGPYFRKFWELSIELQFMENMVYHHSNHVSWPIYLQMMTELIVPNNIKVEMFENTEEYRYEPFSSVVDLTKMKIEHFIAWLFHAMPVISRVNLHTYDRDYLCPYCEINLKHPKFYDIERYKRHICYTHGVMHKGTWTKPPVILNIGDNFNEDGTPLHSLIICPTCHTEIDKNSIGSYNRHYVTHHHYRHVSIENLL